MRLTLHQNDGVARPVRLKIRDASHLVLEGEGNNDSDDLVVPLSDIEAVAASDEGENRMSITTANSGAGGTLLVSATTPMEMHATVEGLGLLSEFQ